MLSRAQVCDILSFWFPNTKFQAFWFDKSVDDIIRKKYQLLLHELMKDIDNIINDLNIELFNTQDGRDYIIAVVIMLDQFTRNIYRDDKTHIIKNDEYAFIISKFVIDNYLDLQYDIHQRIFFLLPYRHHKHYVDINTYAKYLDIVLNRIKLYNLLTESTLDEINILKKITLATIKDYSALTEYDIEKCDNNKSVNTIQELIKKYSHDILDAKCNLYQKDILYEKKLLSIKSEKLFIIMNQFINTHINVPSNATVCVSLSGGVDSMVIACILKHVEIMGLIRKVIAVHIYYGNRGDSMDETEFIKDWCAINDIQLIIKYIRYMKRSDELIDRENYEQITNDIRFDTYKFIETIVGKICGVCLGHHEGDQIENILMNIMNGKQYGDIMGMYPVSNIKDVDIWRPFLLHPKSDIFEFAHSNLVPYTKDTTPLWSNRGKIRNKLYPLLQEIFPGFDKKLLDFGNHAVEYNIEQSNKLNELCNSIVFEEYGCKISNLTELYKINDSLWIKYLLHIFYTIGIKMTNKPTQKLFIIWFKRIINSSKTTYSSRFDFTNGYCAIIYLNHLYIIQLSLHKDFPKKYLATK
jgi:tRNA(Ile)-lysidine synthetase-like protein